MSINLKSRTAKLIAPKSAWEGHRYLCELALPALGQRSLSEDADSYGFVSQSSECEKVHSHCHACPVIRDRLIFYIEERFINIVLQQSFYFTHQFRAIAAEFYQPASLVFGIQVASRKKHLLYLGLERVRAIV
jgi:hypothetical protein